MAQTLFCPSHRKNLGSGMFPPTVKQVHLIAGPSQQRRAHAGNISSTAKYAFAFMLSQGSYLSAPRFLLLWDKRVYLLKRPVGYCRNKAIACLLLTADTSEPKLLIY